MTNIPDHIRKKIEEEAEKIHGIPAVITSYSARHASKRDCENFIEAASYGYSLAMQEVGDWDEIINEAKEHANANAPKILDKNETYYFWHEVLQYIVRNYNPVKEPD